MGGTQSKVAQPKPRPVRQHISIDFGTSHSGFAVLTGDLISILNPTSNNGIAARTLDTEQRVQLDNHISYNASWPGSTSPYPKAPTAILYDKCGRVVAWGNEARKQLVQMKAEEQQKHIYLDRFKLFLDTSREHNDPAMAKLTKACGKTIVDVIGDYLIELNKAIKEFVNRLDPIAKYDPFNVKWCVTVPAMWNDAAKDKMKRAMHKAQLIQTLESDRIVFCSEPMAGLLAETLSNTGHQFGRTDPILLVDLELVPGLGASCGSTILDEHFLDMIRRAVGHKAFDEGVAEKQRPGLTLVSDWETAKVQFIGSADRNFETRISISRAIMKRRLQEAGDTPLVPGVMVVLVKRMLDRLKRVRGFTNPHILCVGGFSQSQYLVQELRKRLPVPSDRVVVSRNGASAILFGAPVFACRPELVSNQVARFTHVSSFNGQFEALINKGSTMIPDVVMCTKEYRPSACTDKEIVVDIHVTAMEKLDRPLTAGNSTKIGKRG
ncbi:hypothetical protein AMAG_07350 [Allomyces macrogynus ATCC 38327]|uniref:Hsp70-like protein n=1 Tax=Allomyces macrogynus (strain ATCC 38327) TaxID=578462 RepID=A0A0L0SIE1_ALLM3|nr:hypothetical protein AMAG_07350 [Allomyces macrogynus ATCC 38327]|eukprot:KNE62100.1 hypothetical protein AMAG_07350 [Allomyces macrogynus ATCC 38327]